MVRPAPASADRIQVPAPPDDLCLTFANTRSWRGSAEPLEELSDAGALLRWAETACGLPVEVIRRVETEVIAAEPRFGAAIALRETIYRVFAAIAEDQACRPADLAALNAAFAEAPVRERLFLTDMARGWEVWPGGSIPALLAPVLWSAGDLLLGQRAGRVRQCANPACLWLFLDDSKSGNRRWCSMSSCGNRAKAHRHYLRRKGANSAPGENTRR